MYVPSSSEAPEATGPFGAKSVGEPAVIPTAPAIIDAIHNAAGVWMKELPAAPEKLWRLLRGLTVRPMGNQHNHVFFRANTP